MAFSKTALKAAHSPESRAKAARTLKKTIARKKREAAAAKRYGKVVEIPLVDHDRDFLKSLTPAVSSAADLQRQKLEVVHEVVSFLREVLR